MFSRSNYRSNGTNSFFGRRKYYLRPWIFLNRRQQKRHHDDINHKHNSVMMSGDSPVFGTRLSHNLPGGYDLPDEARPGHITPVLQLAPMEKVNDDNHIDPEVIEDNGDAERDELKPIATREHPSPESRPKIERNGINGNNKSTDRDHIPPEDDDACVKCIYVAQQCCECVIS